MTDLDRLIEDGIKEIDNEIQAEDDIRDQGEYIARMLAMNPVVKVPVANKLFALTMRMVKDSMNRKIILLAAEDQVKKELYGNRYTPALYNAEYNDYYTLEENCQTLVTTFLGHVTGNLKIETLEDESDETVKIAREKDMIKQ